MPRDALTQYHKKRNFGITAEPKGKVEATKKSRLAFVIQKHGATRLHYDFRLELDGVMKSWAVTRGPSYDPADKRLAVHVEDHPVEYNKFEGVIPAGQYGGGPVMIWDRGTWTPEGDPRKGLAKGRLTFTMEGSRMQGRWHLVRMHGKPDEKRDNWLLIKGDDEYVLTGEKNKKFLDVQNTSIISGRTLDEIREGKKKAEAGKPVKSRRISKSAPSKTAGTQASLEKLRKKYGSVELATLVEFPPESGDWWHEIKYDGYRLLAFVSHGDVVLQTRGGKDWTHKFQPLAEELAALGVDSAVIDGEACVLNEKGQTSFSGLQQALSEGAPEKIEGWFFDLLYLDGKDYAGLPLSERKAALKKVLKKGKLLHYSEHFESSPHLLDKACKIGAEGLVSKRKDSLYKGRRTHDWLKSKCGLEQEFVIGGFMPAKDDSKAVGSLLLGYYRNGKLAYAGKVGTGFGRELSKDMYSRLIKLEAKDSPFTEKTARGRRGYIWVKPQQLCEISFWEWTADGHIRHGSFKGLREDKAPQAVRKEEPEKPPKANESVKTVKANKNLTVEGIVITHPEREVFPGTGITKGEVAEYYGRVLPYVMPFAEGRLLSLLRCTETIDGECFFQRAPMKGGYGFVHGLTDSHKGSKHNYLYIEKPQGIIELAQMGTIEFHAWQSKVKTAGKPDQMIFDLDPHESVPFEAVKLAAQDVRNRLKDRGLESFPRLTGGKGIHVVVPLKPKLGWEEVKAFTQKFALQMQYDAPEAYIATMSKDKRRGKIFVDYLRNEYSSTAIIPFSLRARKGAPLAVPVTWKELDKFTSAAPFNIGNIEKRLNAATREMIEEFLSTSQTIKL